jgi:cyclopropane fatty-acyl-phospholipid synthase-like methyltransferase
MGEINSGPRALLNNPATYLSLQRLLGGKRAHLTFVTDHLRLEDGDRVLDIGCGPGDARDAMPDVDYLGVDLNCDYIRAAQERYGESAQFRCVDVRSGELAKEDPFDVVVAMGLLHHLDDDAVRGLVREISGLLNEGGRFVSIDPTFVEKQPRIARWLIGFDRGEHVRTPEAVQALVGESIPGPTATVRADLLRVPYTHVVIEAEAQ